MSKQAKMFKYMPVFGVSRVGYSSGEIGDTGVTTVEVVFTRAVQAADFTAGVTIKKNTVAQTINSGTLQGDNVTVFYVLNVAADINDVLTWESSQAAGNIQDLAGRDLADVSAKTQTNYIGSHLYFDTADCSGHLLRIGV